MPQQLDPIRRIRILRLLLDDLRVHLLLVIPLLRNVTRHLKRAQILVGPILLLLDALLGPVQQLAHRPVVVMDGLVLLPLVLLEQLLRAETQDVVQLLLGEVGALAAHAGPHHQMREHHLALGHLRDALLHAVARHEAVDHDLVGLADAVGAREGLDVVVGVPVRVVDDDGVGGGEVDAEAARPASGNDGVCKGGEKMFWGVFTVSIGEIRIAGRRGR